MKVRVFCYEGYRGGETPRAFTVGEQRVEVACVLDRWRGQDHEYFKVDASDGIRYILRYDRNEDAWEITLMEAPGCPPDPREGRRGS